MKRRQFLQTMALTGVSALVANTPLKAAEQVKSMSKSAFKSKAGFTLWQLPSQVNTIGNSYVLLTNKGRIIVMDGGAHEEEHYLRGFLSALGAEVEAWFISHPHSDHMGALHEILKELNDIKIKHIYHSRLTDEMVAMDKGDKDDCMGFYKLLDKGDIPVTDIQEPGVEYTFDGLKVKILSVKNEEIRTGVYNNSSMIIRAWDKQKSCVFLGDAEVPCGEKVLAGPYRSFLDCDYLQMAHHGQGGCSEHFYKTVKFNACMWPTPTWVWNNDFGGGINTGTLTTFETRRWMDEKGIKEHHVSCMGLWRLA